MQWYWYFTLMLLDFFFSFVARQKRHFHTKPEITAVELFSVLIESSTGPYSIFYDGESKENALNVTDRFWTTMGMGNILLLSQVIAFLVSFLGSFFIFIPVSINLQEFDSHCLLGAKGTWNFSSGNVMLMDIKWGLHSDCGFAIFIGIVVMIFSVFFIVWQSVNLFKNTDRYMQLNHVNYFFQLIKRYFGSILMKCTSG